MWEAENSILRVITMKNRDTYLFRLNAQRIYRGAVPEIGDCFALFRIQLNYSPPWNVQKLTDFSAWELVC
jgi:hypothetical protein